MQLTEMDGKTLERIDGGNRDQNASQIQEIFAEIFL